MNKKQQLVCLFCIFLSLISCKAFSPALTEQPSDSDISNTPQVLIGTQMCVSEANNQIQTSNNWPETTVTLFPEKIINKHQSEVNALVWGPSGLVSGGSDSAVFTWDLNADEPVDEWSAYTVLPDGQIRFNVDTTLGPVISLSVSPETGRIAAGESSGFISVYPDEHFDDDRYLFGLEASFVEGLDGGSLTDELREQFQQNGLTLGSPTRVEIKYSGHEWSLQDARYMLDAQNNKLDVYQHLFTYHFFMGLDLDVLDALSAQLVPDKLYAEFQASGHPISLQSRVEIDEDGQTWVITDGDARYVLQLDQNALNVRQYLFSVDGEAVNELDAGLLSEQLRQQFQEQGYTFGSQVQVLVNQPGQNWAIEQAEYLLEFKNGGIKVSQYQPVTAITWSPDGTEIVSAAGNQIYIKPWSTGGASRVLEMQTVPVEDLDWSPNGRCLASLTRDGVIKIWDSSTWSVLGSLDQSVGVSKAIDWSPDGHKIALAANDNVIIWDTASQTLLQEFSGHSDAVLDVGWSPDGRLVASVAEDNKVLVWSLESTKPVYFLQGHEYNVTAVAWTGNDRLATGDRNGQIMLWSLLKTTAETGALSTSISMPVAPITSIELPGILTATDIQLDFGPDQDLLAAGASDALFLLNTRTQEITLQLGYEFGFPKPPFDGLTLKPIDGSITSVAMSPTDPVVVCGLDNGNVLFWDHVTNTFLGSAIAHSQPVTDLAWSPDGKELASASEDGSVLVWNAKTFSVIDTLATTNAPVYNVAWSPVGTYLAIESNSLEIQVIQRSDLSVVKTFPGLVTLNKSLSWSADGRYLAFSSSPGMAVVDSETWTAQTLSLPNGDFAQDAAISPDGKRVVAATFSNGFVVWNVESGLIEFQLLGIESVKGIAWSSNGTTLAAGNGSGEVVLWSLP